MASNGIQDVNWMTALVQDTPSVSLHPWTQMNGLIKEQSTFPCDLDLNDNLNQIPEDIKVLMQGKKYGLSYDYISPMFSKPDWFDEEKFQRGQEFAMRNYFSVNFAEMISLYLLFSFPENLYPLIYTNKSNVPYTAFKRYLSTVNRVRSWYEGDIWNNESLAYKNLKFVRFSHLNVDRQLKNSSNEELEQKCDLHRVINATSLWANLNGAVRQDFGGQSELSVCPLASHNLQFDQWKMSITQFGFMGLIVLYPREFGISNASDSELEGFVHLWRTLGYLLGVDEEFNFCKGSLDEVRQRCRDFIEFAAKPQLKIVSEDWEHMSRCMTEGVSYYVPGVQFESSLRFLFSLMDINASNFRKSMSWNQTIMYYILKFTMNFTLKLPGMMSFHTRLLKLSLDRITNTSEDSLERFRMRNYVFQNSLELNA